MMVTTGTMKAQPRLKSPISGRLQIACCGARNISATLANSASTISRKPRRIWPAGFMRPATRPLQAAPPMMPPMLQQKNQKNCVGASPRC